MRWRQLLRDPHFHAYAFRCGAASQRAEWRSGSTKNISRCRRLCVLFDWLWHTREQKRRLAVGGGENPRVNGDETVSIPTSFSDGTGPWLGSELRRREPAVGINGPGWLSSNPL